MIKFLVDYLLVLLPYAFLIGVPVAIIYLIVASVPALTDIFGWILFPDVDVSIRGGEEFKRKYTRIAFVLYIWFFWWIRLTKVSLYHVVLILGLVSLGIFSLVLIVIDRIKKIINFFYSVGEYYHHQTGL